MMRGRAKFKPQAYDLYNKAMLLITGNPWFRSQNLSGAIGRRIGVLKAYTVVKKRENCFSNMTRFGKEVSWMNFQPYSTGL